MRIHWKEGVFFVGGVGLLLPLAVAKVLCCRLTLFWGRVIFSWFPSVGLLLLGIALGLWWGRRSQPWGPEKPMTGEEARPAG